MNAMPPPIFIGWLPLAPFTVQSLSNAEWKLVCTLIYKRGKRFQHSLSDIKIMSFVTKRVPYVRNHIFIQPKKKEKFSYGYVNASHHFYFLMFF